MSQQFDLVIVGAGAAGLAAAIFAGEAARDAPLRPRILLLDGARKPGAKILVSGGGRCNVTNVEVTPEDFNGGPKPIIRNVLRAFDHRRTLAWMEDLGVALKLEETGKYFPVSDKAATVLEALLARVRHVGVELRPSTRITGVRRLEGGFEVEVAESAPIRCRAVVMATGGLALPKSGSDGAGLRMLAAMGHTIVPTTPALVPLLLGAGMEPASHFAEWSGLTLDMRLELAASQASKPTASYTGSLLFTHFGISGPVALNISRHWLRARNTENFKDINLYAGLPRFASIAAADGWLRELAGSNPKRQLANALQAMVPERLARAFAGDSTITLGQLTRPERQRLSGLLAAMPLPVVGDRGYSFAETTAGGVELREIQHATMESRVVPGLFLCGELLDVDGRIGGFNFQWAWASGYLAGRAAIARVIQAFDPPPPR
jgi:predicted Rossmann fold flavoprotein